MNTTKKKAKLTVETWLPIFSGFYGTIWGTDSDEEMEIENINEKREEKKMALVNYDDIEWDYKGYCDQVVKHVTHEIETELQKLGMVESCKFQKLNSPREYNFANDSVDIEISLSLKNMSVIREYLLANRSGFIEYLADKYTSYDGFISSYSNNVHNWVDDLQATLKDQHKLGAVLNFILLNEDKDLEISIYENATGNGCTLSATNYYDLIGEGA